MSMIGKGYSPRRLTTLTQAGSQDLLVPEVEMKTTHTVCSAASREDEVKEAPPTQSNNLLTEREEGLHSFTEEACDLQAESGR